MRAFILRGGALLPLLLATACSAQTPAPPATPPVGIDLGAAAGQRTAAPVAADPHAHHAAPAPAPAPAGVRGHGTIDSIDPGRRRVTLAHDPMPEIGWPAMTMVFPAPAAVDLRRFKPGDHVDFTLRPGQGGAYDLIDLRPGDH